ncbi:hypothetical protein C1I95_23625 [Micromonospora craterilacus]|uniref:Uncharacterized protein n=1 Tax=Micromonospora craterilacus TaxID=1655439 RepID=A0A2W2DNA6_9ACTN|nr:hypothetical protein [Micromonospora craterilacus]PZG13446.1 hypothetical protein C1I95_23625 [Micromonospora craterilacus]
MNDSFLHRAANAAGYRLEPHRLAYAAVTNPEDVAEWIAGAARYAAANAIRGVLQDAVQTLRVRLAEASLARRGADREALDRVMDLLIAIDDDFEAALRDIGHHSVALAEMDPPPLVDDPTATILPAAQAGRQKASNGKATDPLPRARPHDSGNPLPQGRRRPRARP